MGKVQGQFGCEPSHEGSHNRKDDDDPFQKNCPSDNFLVLIESDIPGASLNGKTPQQLNVHQLKRWLACRGAPLKGKKPDKVNLFYVQYSF